MLPARKGLGAERFNPPTTATGAIFPDVTADCQGRGVAACCGPCINTVPPSINLAQDGLQLAEVYATVTRKRYKLNLFNFQGETYVPT